MGVAVLKKIVMESRSALITPTCLENWKIQSELWY